MVEEVNKNLSPLHRWAELKKNLLGLDKLKPYDVYVTVFDKATEKKYGAFHQCPISSIIGIQMTHF